MASFCVLWSSLHVHVLVPVFFANSFCSCCSSSIPTHHLLFPRPYCTLISLTKSCLFNEILSYLFKFYAVWQQVETLYGDNRPLDDNQRSIIDANRRQIHDLIEPRQSLIKRLYATKCFNRQHKDHIECGVTPFDKVENLLDVVRRRSVADYKKLVDALYRDGQSSSARILQKGGGKSVEDIAGILTVLQDCKICVTQLYE